MSNQYTRLFHGPLHSEQKSKFNLIDNETADTVEYDYKNTFKFRPDLTKGLTGKELITIPHIIIMVKYNRSFA
jgi:hypothetical protein